MKSVLLNDPHFVMALAQVLDQQCIIGFIDVKQDVDEAFHVYTYNCSCPRDEPISVLLKLLPERSICELYLNSINQVGTGQGYDLRLLDLIPQELNLPTILAGGASHSQHLINGLQYERVNAVATAHLFNFVGNELEKASKSVRTQGVDLANWPHLSELKTIVSVQGITI